MGAAAQGVRRAHAPDQPEEVGPNALSGAALACLDAAATGGPVGGGEGGTVPWPYCSTERWAR
ncbi:hypothetical protein GCM10010320_74900 [Streptomyces caelestis]|nr:hypothetical protein GCM10010320_74900 [Streptomyces caelestis]